jgi:hypothetical protein
MGKTPKNRAQQTKAEGSGGTGAEGAAWKEIRSRVAAATVRLKRGGLGILVPCDFILTAAHCVRWSVTGSMTTNAEPFHETVKTHDGGTYKLEVYAVEPVADIAVLGPIDSDEYFEDEEAFEEFTAAVEGIPLFARPVEVK